VSLVPADLVQAARTADILIVRAPLPPELFASASRCRAAIGTAPGST